MCLDTTASNNGKKAGACTLLEKGLRRNLLHLTSRHHVMEIIAEKTFSVINISPSTGSNRSILILTVFATIGVANTFGPRLMVFLVVGPLINPSSLHLLSKRTLFWTGLLRKLRQFALLQLILLRQSFLSQMLVSQSSGK